MIKIQGKIYMTVINHKKNLKNVNYYFNFFPTLQKMNVNPCYRI